MRWKQDKRLIILLIWIAKGSGFIVDMDILFFICRSFYPKLDMLAGLLKCHQGNLWYPAYHINMSSKGLMVTLDLWLLLSVCKTSWKGKYERAAKMKGRRSALTLQQNGEKESERAVRCLWALISNVISVLITHLYLDRITHWITGNYSALDTVLEPFLHPRGLHRHFSSPFGNQVPLFY